MSLKLKKSVEKNTNQLHVDKLYLMIFQMFDLNTMGTQLNVEHLSYIIINSFLVTFSSGSVSSEDFQEHNNKEKRRHRMSQNVTVALYKGKVETSSKQT